MEIELFNPKALPALTESLYLNELEFLLSDFPKYRSKQIFNWILKGADSFDKMSNIPKPLREELKKKFRVFSGEIVSCHDDSDAKKIVIECGDGVKIEAVLLNDGGQRHTACVSTQAGCPCGCVFCKTGSLGFKRDLTSAEIIEQYLRLLNVRKTLSSDGEINNDQYKQLIDNIVIMGMGEPLLNLGFLRKAISIFTDPDGLNISKRRITVSTCGITESLFDIAKNGPYIKLALSLTTADEKKRTSLMPITKSNSLSKIKEALFLFQKNGGGRVTLEIPLLGGINTSEKDASSVYKFAKGLKAAVNIIPWNPVDDLEFNGSPLREPDKKETDEYIKTLMNFNMNVTTRLHKGRKVMGACGQLGSVGT
ncbi:MAG: 23S rRNA (adenine(2503)-C(2))-methyltransferase RlmN [Treponema sp.]|nr:23S rRNA (adenine(2503)-C(2))-methyltransferase RlmN [Treponema sp.]